ncbi:MAG: MgtC/SapB family protein [Candidatus Promineifilaceae bacterium]|nr:MgtC/SapB family protein [Candidatus Promineifilaceae bacterium]
MLDLLEQFSGSDFFKLTIAFLLALPVAYDREQSTRIMGLRTFPLVAIATCGYVLIGQTFIEASDGGAQARILQGLVAGIGFIGGGAILKKDDRVLGTASAASIWTTGAIGIAVAYARYDIALFLMAANFVVLRWLTPLKHYVPQFKEE